MSSPTPDPGVPALPADRGWREPAAVLALTLAGALVALTLLRAATLGGEYYDAYETRAAARVLLGQQAGAVPVYRSPLLIAWSVPWEALGWGWRPPALLSALAYAGLLVLVAALARALGARPWVAAACALLAALDRVAWAYAPHGLPGVLTASLCGAALLVATRPGRPWPARPWALGLVLGLAALGRPNAGLLGLALLAGLPRLERGAAWREAPLARLAAAGALALALYLLAFTALHAWARGSLAGGLSAHGDLARFQAQQLSENRARYGGDAPPLGYLLALAISSPWLALLVPAALLRLRAALPAARVLLAWVGLHLGFLLAVAGHLEARYLLPALPALAALAALPLEGVAARLRGPAARVGVVLALAFVPLALGGRYEARRALDPVTRHSVPARIAAAAARLAGPQGRFLWTTTHTYPIAPRVVLEEGSPYPGDPFCGIYHAGPVVLAYHLRRPVPMLLGQGAGLVDPARLTAFVRAAEGFRPGDVLLVGRASLSGHAQLREQPAGPFRLYPLRPGPQGLRLGEPLVFAPPAWEDPSRP